MMVYLNHDCHNYPAATPDAFGGSRCICIECQKKRGEVDTDSYKILRRIIDKMESDKESIKDYTKKTSPLVSEKWNIDNYFLNRYQVERVIRECIDRPKGIVPDSVYDLLPDIRF